MGRRHGLAILIWAWTWGGALLRGQAPAGAYSAVDAHALAAPVEAERTVESLAAYLTGPGSPARTEEEKARALFRWIADRIAYAEPEGTVEAPPAQVLSAREAVCFGYAGLYEALCAASGLKCAVISGFGKGRTYLVGDATEGPPNHAWNAVWASDRWNLVDCTWGAGRTDEKGRFVRRFDGFFFFTPPRLFFETHFPDDPSHQFLDPPLSRKAFEALPHVQSTFHELGLSWIGGPPARLRVGEEAVLFVEAPRNVCLMARLLSRDGADQGDRTLVLRSEGRVTVRALCPSRGLYVLRLLARRGGGPEPLAWAADLLVEASAGAGPESRFPYLYQEYVDLGCALLSPLRSPLGTGRRETFRLTAPGAVEAVVVTGRKWERLRPGPGGFEGTVKIRPGEIKVAARYPDRTGYTVLIRFDAAPPGQDRSAPSRGPSESPEAP
ncbi:MAG: transglutaminase domain-containing protein [Acidobacteriota bacterium]